MECVPEIKRKAEGKSVGIKLAFDEWRATEEEIQIRSLRRNGK